MALAYNWWRCYCQAAKPGAWMEAITSCALLLAGVGRAVKHAGQTTLHLTPMQAAVDKLRASLGHESSVAQKLPKTKRWKAFVDDVVAKITRPLPPWLPQDRLALSNCRIFIKTRVYAVIKMFFV